MAAPHEEAAAPGRTGGPRDTTEVAVLPDQPNAAPAKLSDHDRIVRMADSLHDGQGNPRLVLVVRFYRDGHVWIGTLDAENRRSEGLTDANLAVAAAHAAEIVARVGQTAFKALAAREDES
jgi:hypothetical protein